MNKHCARFRDKHIEHEELMAIVFGGLAATGKSQWTLGENLPTTGLLDESSGDINPNEDGGAENVGITNLTMDEGAPSGGSLAYKVARRKRGEKQDMKKHLSKKKKLSGAARLSQTMDRMLDVVESQSSELTMKQFADSQNATNAKCIRKLATLPGLKPGHPLYMTGGN